MDEGDGLTGDDNSNEHCIEPPTAVEEAVKDVIPAIPQSCSARTSAGASTKETMIVHQGKPESKAASDVELPPEEDQPAGQAHGNTKINKEP